MKPTVKTTIVELYTTSDGRKFEDYHEALAYQWFLDAEVPSVTSGRILDAIKADLEGFGERIGPILSRPSSEPAESGLDLNQVDPLREGEDASGAEPRELVYEALEGEAAQQTHEQQPKKRRGRPPGSKNKPKAVANGEGAVTT